MSDVADLLGRAVAKLHDELDWLAKDDCGDVACDECQYPRTMLAVADWLEAEADEIPPHATHYRDGLIDDAPAVRVARAYLGERHTDDA